MDHQSNQTDDFVVPPCPNAEFDSIATDEKTYGNHCDKPVTNVSLMSTEEDVRMSSPENPRNCVAVARGDNRLMFRKKRIPPLVYVAALAISFSTTAGMTQLVITHTDVYASIERLIKGPETKYTTSREMPETDVTF